MDPNAQNPNPTPPEQPVQPQTQPQAFPQQMPPPEVVAPPQPLQNPQSPVQQPPTELNPQPLSPPMPPQPGLPSQQVAQPMQQLPPQPPQAPQQFAQPASLGGMYPAQAVGASPFASNNAASKKSKLPLVILLIAAILLILGVVAGGYFYLKSTSGKRPQKYSTSDLITEKKSSYSFQRPKNLVDGSSIKDLNVSSIAATSDFKEEVKLIDRIVKDKDGTDKAGFVSLYAATTPEGTTIPDAEFQSILENQEVKSQLENSIKALITENTAKSDLGCESVKNFNSSISYSKDNFQLFNVVSLDCVLSQAKQKELKDESIHVVYKFGLDDKNTYIIFFAATKKSWDMNQTVFQTTINSFKPN